MGKRLRILVVEDSEDDVALLIRELRRGGFDPAHERVDTAQAMEAALDASEWDVVISDHNMPQFSASQALALLQKKQLDVPFIILSGSISEEIAVAAMRAGAHDFITKGNLARLVPAVERERREAEMRRTRKSIEAQLIQAQKMEAVGRLAGGIAHDFNNFLSVILGYSDFVAGALKEGAATENLKADVEEIKSAAKKAASLTRQLLAFSRRQVLQPVVMDLNATVSNMEKMCQRLIGEDIDIVTDLDPGLEAINADPGQMEQMIMNLAVNARDAMPNGGQLTIRTKNVEIGARGIPSAAFPVRPGPYVVLTVADTGAGMTPEVKSRIFEPFFTTKEKGKGTGLGLATVFGTVKQSGGYIVADSEPGRGAAFSIYLPSVTEAVVPAPSSSSPSARLAGSETILIVEDEEKIRGMVRKFLEMRGYTVFEAAGGHEALRLAQDRKKPFDLLVTDLVMPEMNGLELSSRLKSASPSTKILYMTGYTDHAILRQEVPEFQSNVLMKPFTSQELNKKVREVLDGPRAE